MKNLIIIIAIVFTPSFQVFGQCASLFSNDDISKYELTIYNKKGKIETINQYHVIDRNASTVSLEARIMDNNNNEFAKTEMNYNCNNGTIEMDMANMQSSMMPNMKDLGANFEMDIQSKNIQYPTSMEIGQTLPEASIEIKMSGMVVSQNNTTNRQVVSKETVTTSAGTFECFKITSDNIGKVGFQKKKLEHIEWFSTEMGFIVKSESYDKGKLTTHAELTALN